MKRTVLVLGLLLAAVFLFAKGISPAAEGIAQLRQDRDRLQLKDGSCQDEPDLAVAANSGTKTQDQDQDRLKDGSCDGVPDQDRDRTQTGKP